MSSIPRNFTQNASGIIHTPRLFTPSDRQRAYLLQADPVVASKTQGLQGQLGSLVGVEIKPLVGAIGCAAGRDLLAEAAARGNLERADALVTPVELDVEVDDILWLLELLSDRALVVLERLFAAPAGAIARVSVARQLSRTALAAAAPLGPRAHVVGAGFLRNGSPPVGVDDGCGFGGGWSVRPVREGTGG